MNNFGENQWKNMLNDEMLDQMFDQMLDKLLGINQQEPYNLQC